MPKMKTKSGAKKRFKVTGTGKVKFGAAGKRHRLFSHSGDFVRQNRRTRVLSDSDVQHVLDWMPYARGKKRKAPAKKAAATAKTAAKATKKTAGGA